MSSRLAFAGVAKLSRSSTTPSRTTSDGADGGQDDALGDVTGLLDGLTDVPADLLDAVADLVEAALDATLLRAAPDSTLRSARLALARAAGGARSWRRAWPTWRAAWRRLGLRRTSGRLAVRALRALVVVRGCACAGEAVRFVVVSLAWWSRPWWRNLS